MKSNTYAKVTYPAEYWNTCLVDKIQAIILPTQQSGGVYLGNYEGANDLALLRRYNIVSILTTATQCQLNFKDVKEIEYHYILPIPINQGFDIMQYFQKSYQFIDEQRSFGNVLVQCFSGSDRSPAFILAYIMKKYFCNVERAYDLIKYQAPQVNINHEYLHQLLKYEQHLHFLNQKLPNPKEKWADLEMRTNAAKKKGITFEIKKKEQISELEQVFIRSNYVIDNKFDFDDLKQEIENQEMWLEQFKHT